jgi:hypothetical protein
MRKTLLLTLILTSRCLATAPTLAQAAQVQYLPIGTSSSIAYGSNTTANNTGVFCYGSDATGDQDVTAISANETWTLVKTGYATTWNTRASCWTAKLAGGADTLNLTISGSGDGYKGAMLLEVHSADGILVLDGSAITSTGSSSTVSTQVNDEIVIGWQAGADGLTQGTGWTLAGYFSFNAFETGVYKIVSSTGTYTATFSATPTAAVNVLITLSLGVGIPSPTFSGPVWSAFSGLGPH